MYLTRCFALDPQTTPKEILRMKLITKSIFLICLFAIGANAQISNFKHVVVIVQENRTPDNLFQGLCSAPFGSASSCSTTPNSSQYNIQTSNWLDKTSPGNAIQPGTVKLNNKYDLDHSHTGWLAMCDLTPVGAPIPGICKMDGADGVNCVGKCPDKPQFNFVLNKKHILDPYLHLATQYGWANYMFQTNQGPSFPAHQFLFGATSAPTTADDANGVYASSNMTSTGGTGGTDVVAGCTAAANTKVKVISPGLGESQEIYPCFEHQTMGDLFDNAPLQVPITWRYYAPSRGSIWTAPNSIGHICQSTGPGGDCVGQQWKDNVDVPENGGNGSTDVLTDIQNCKLRSVTWVIPTCENSDHAKCNDGGGPSWVSSIVNAIGASTQCDGGTGYWKDTAIFITWDDWGGWYDHERPTILNGNPGSYQYGFRVPLLVVSAYTPQGYINNNRHDFGSILRFIQHNFGLQQGALGFADARSQTDLQEFFNLSQPARTFQSVRAPKTAAFFLSDKRRGTDPDDDN
jgi:phospholipase C